MRRLWLVGCWPGFAREALRRRSYRSPRARKTAPRPGPLSGPGFGARAKNGPLSCFHIWMWSPRMQRSGKATPFRVRSERGLSTAEVRWTPKESPPFKSWLSWNSPARKRPLTGTSSCWPHRTKKPEASRERAIWSATRLNSSMTRNSFSPKAAVSNPPRPVCPRRVQAPRSGG